MEHRAKSKEQGEWGEPFGFAQDRPFGFAQDRPFGFAQDKE
jgi:hypothetical protein